MIRSFLEAARGSGDGQIAEISDFRFGLDANLPAELRDADSACSMLMAGRRIGGCAIGPMVDRHHEDGLRLRALSKSIVQQDRRTREVGTPTQGDRARKMKHQMRMPVLH